MTAACQSQVLLWCQWDYWMHGLTRRYQYRYPHERVPTPYSELTSLTARQHSRVPSQLVSLAAMSRPDMSRTRTDYGSVTRKGEVPNSMANEDREEDITIVVHSK